MGQAIITKQDERFGQKVYYGPRGQWVLTKAQAVKRPLYMCRQMIKKLQEPGAWLETEVV